MIKTLSWKTDWGPSDNHARNGSADIERLLNNLEALRVQVNEKYGFFPSVQPPTVDGYRTLPFADFLNAVEAMLEQIHVWGLDWVEAGKTWVPTGAGPDYADVNRWERNGQSVDEALPRIETAWYYMGDLYMGEV